MRAQMPRRAKRTPCAVLSDAHVPSALKDSNRYTDILNMNKRFPLSLLAITSLLWPLASTATAKNIATVGGRFQLIQLSDARRDQFLLDTESGKLWTSVCALTSENGNDCSISYWSEEKVEGKNTKLSDIVEMVNRTEKIRRAKKVE